VTHDDTNYVVDAEKCNVCMDCIAPCPTGSIDNWRVVASARVYSLVEQLGWSELPTQEDLGAATSETADAGDEEVEKLLADNNTHIFICGLRDMETGVEEAMADVCRKHGLDWAALKPEMRTSGRYHVETY
jgi:Fe-S-cluster-containing hydrogenase component 2